MSVFALAIICVLVLVPIGIVLKPTKKTAVEKTKPAARLPKSKPKLVNEFTEKQLEDFYHLAEQILDDSGNPPLN
ncbi:MAG: hypothetical protein HRU08_10090 [Oleispira sp.]|nr:hypothetical protein [Oleispira sp.]